MTTFEKVILVLFVLGLWISASFVYWHGVQKSRSRRVFVAPAVFVGKNIDQKPLS